MVPQRQYSSAQAGSRPRVVVIGAGFAGLSCAYQLKRPGADMQLLEARNRVGGRVFSLDALSRVRLSKLAPSRSRATIRLGWPTPRKHSGGA